MAIIDRAKNVVNNIWALRPGLFNAAVGCTRCGKTGATMIEHESNTGATGKLLDIEQ